MSLPDYVAKYKDLEAGTKLEDVTVAVAGAWGATAAAVTMHKQRWQHQRRQQQWQHGAMAETHVAPSGQQLWQHGCILQESCQITAFAVQGQLVGVDLRA